nr:Wadjet anti-phage system protein JetD domain-containing protein [uncultured Ruegeria sp.]
MSARKRHRVAGELFAKLLDRHEAAERDGRLGPKIGEFVFQAFRDPDKQRQFQEAIQHAQRIGAVHVEMDKGDLSHLMKRVVLADADVLYNMTGRTPKAGKLAGARSTLERFLKTLPEKHRGNASEAMERLLEKWELNKRPHRMSEDDLQPVKEYLKAYGAALSKDVTDGRDLRTYSRVECGDSKLIERHLTRILAELRAIDLYGVDVKDEMIHSDLGLEKFAHLVQFTADIPFAQSHFDRKLHLGIHPSMIDTLEVSPLRALVTIENYASFNRYVAEALTPNTAVLYTGGWPGFGEKQLIAKLSEHVTQGVFHWGDIDMAGAAIADAVACCSKAPVSLHQMSPDLARKHGKPRSAKAISVSENSPARELIAWLASEDAFTLEQEELDPVPVCHIATVSIPSMEVNEPNIGFSKASSLGVNER